MWPHGHAAYQSRFRHDGLLGIVEWDQSDDFFELMNNAEFKKEAKPLMNAAFPRLDMLHTKIMLKP